MDFYYFDSSATVKNYVREVGSNWVKSVFNSVTTKVIYAVSISEVEVVSAFSRRKKGKTLSSNDAKVASQQFRYDFANDFRVIEVEAVLIDSAVNLAKTHYLRGYDAVQLSAAIKISKQITMLKLGSLVFVSADGDLNTAANAEGLTVENPNNYP